MPPATPTVSVTFVDAGTGRAFARSDLPASGLPDSFASETTLRMGDDTWLVEHAEPLTAAEAAAAGRLVLTVRRLGTVPAADILYSLPTICDTLPALGPAPTSGDCLELHEDDWQQVELASRSLAPAVNAELDHIRRVYEQHGQRDAEGRVFAFRKIHIRSITTLAEPLPWPQVRDLLPTPQHVYAGVSFRGATGAAVGSFALASGPLSWYGIAVRDQVPVLALHLNSAGGAVPVASIEPVLRAFGLVVVDWCRCIAVGPDQLADYLTAITPPDDAAG